MKNFYKKLLFFFIPFVLYIILVILADPYNYWNNCGIIPIEVKMKVSRELNGRLWKIVQFKRTPKPDIMLGDSRVDIIDSERIKELTGKDYYNFGCPSATLEEIIETFWYASERVKLENVIIGCSFNLYNKYNNKNLIKATFESSGVVQYILNGANIKAMAVCFYRMATETGADISAPDMDADAFWIEKLEGPSARFYKLYKYPDNYYTELKEIADYCEANHINLQFFIPPTHTDLQKQVSKYSLIKEDERFRSDLRSLGNVIDFDYENWLTSDRAHFSDPFHIETSLDTIVINALINHEFPYARYSERTITN
jgi:hypothetical protein